MEITAKPATADSGSPNAIQTQVDSLRHFIGSLEVSKDISPSDQMFSAGNERHYFGVGRSAATVIMAGLMARLSYAGGDTTITDILDFGCGHGRVARYLRALFPSVSIYGTEYVKDGLDWCTKRFGYLPLEGDIPESSFDLIWLGSVFTHLPKQIVAGLIADLKRALKPNGLLVFTTQGRHSIRRIDDALAGMIDPIAPWLTYFLSEELTKQLSKSYWENQYGYVDYNNQQNYGVAIAPLTWYLDQAAIGDDHVVVCSQERSWDSHQDVTIVMRSSVTSLEKGSFF